MRGVQKKARNVPGFLLMHKDRGSLCAHGKSFAGMPGLFYFINKGDGIGADAHVAAAIGENHDQVVFPGAAFSRVRAILKEIRG